MKTNPLLKFIAYAIIPFVTIMILLVIFNIIKNALVMILWSIVIYMISFIISSILAKMGGQKVLFKNWRDFWRKIAWILVKSVIFATGLVGLTYAFVTDNSPFMQFEFPYLIQDVRFFVVLGITYLLAALLIKISFGGE